MGSIKHKRLVLYIRVKKDIILMRFIIIAVSLDILRWQLDSNNSSVYGSNPDIIHNIKQKLNTSTISLHFYEGRTHLILYRLFKSSVVILDII